MPAVLQKPWSRRTATIGFVEAARAALTADTTTTPCGVASPRFDPATIGGLPPPARRLLLSSLPEGTPLSTLVELQMDGEIELGGRWWPFSADQTLRSGVGFVWAPVVGRRLIRFVGADTLGPDGARIEFRFHDLVPVVRATGADIHRSAQGRLAAETVAWLPQALTPQAGARWVGADDERAIVTIDAAGADIDVEVAVDADGRLSRLGLQRWNDSAEPPAFAPFGGSVESIHTAANGVRIAGSGVVGWGWQTPAEADGLFFRYRITHAAFDAATAGAGPS